MKPILFYHAKCPDGFGSAYAFWRKYGDEMDYVPLNHYDQLPELTGREVFFADIARSEKEILEINSVAKELQVLDHHVSAWKELNHLEFCHFDMEHSGAVISWKYNFPDEEVPTLLKYIQDRDFWKFELVHSDEVLAAIDSYGMTFEIWQDLDRRLSDPEEMASLLKEGKAILRYNKTLIDRLKQEAHTLKIRGHEVPAINTPFFRSEIVGELAKGRKFAAGYHFDGEKFVFSLRSRKGGFDVSELAGTFPGGGGHQQSAGFSVLNLKDLNI